MNWARVFGFAAALCVAGGCRSARPIAVVEPTSARPIETPKVMEPREPVRREWTEIGRSVERRALEARTTGCGAKRIYVIGGIHGNESEGLGAAENLGVGVEGVTLRVVKDANPDGTARRVRGNARGLDLNRNWPASNGTSRGSALSEPEAAALHRDIEAFEPNVIVVFHSAGSGPFVNFDGPARELAEAFAEASRRDDARWRVVPQMGYKTPGSMGSYYGVDRGIPILTIEFRRGQDSASASAAVRVGMEAVARAFDGGGLLRSN